MAAAQPPEPGIETELRPLEFGAALTMAASWYFFGPWGIIPTVWFAYLIVRNKPRWLGATGRLLPARTRRALAETTSIAQARWRELSAPWREETDSTLFPSVLSQVLSM